MEKQTNMFLRISDVIERLSIWFSVLIMSVLAINLVVAVIFRYFFNNPIYWADELSLVLFGWITFLGAAIGVKKSELASVTIIVDRVKGRPLFFLKLFIQISIASFAILLGFYGFTWITSESVLNQMATTLPIPIWVTFAVLPISMLLMILFCIDNIYRLIRYKGERPDKEDIG